MGTPKHELQEATIPHAPEVKPPEPITAKEAAYLIKKLDCNLPLQGHQDRNTLAHCVNKLQAIVDAS